MLFPHTGKLTHAAAVMHLDRLFADSGHSGRRGHEPTIVRKQR